MELWETIDLINSKLREKFLCVPFCYNINGQYVKKIYDAIEANENYEDIVLKLISLPWQRAYQIEYRYKHIEIIKPYLNVIEYATYDLFNRNFICAYLSLIPVVEAILRKWAEKKPENSFNKLVGGIPKFLEYWEKENNKIKNNEALKKCFEHEIEYMKYILNIFYTDFDTYKEQNFSEIFNRNLSLHKLEGLSNEREVMYNLHRIYLLIDVIADLYTMSDYKKYFLLSMHADFEKDLDFLFRSKFYCMKRMKISDMSLLEIYLENSTDESKKGSLIQKIDKIC